MLNGPTTELSRERRANAEEFLRSRALSLSTLEAIITRRTGPMRHVLLTSSPVHGLANRLSDIDTICIRGDLGRASKMASQIFEGKSHLEYITFSHHDVESDLRALAWAAAAGPLEGLRSHRNWDGTRVLRRKYLERLVNGLATDGTMPFLDSLPALSAIWKWASLHAALCASVCGLLASLAGQARGPLAYALNALTWLQDAMMSHHGEVYSNRKWYLLRWRRFRLRGGPSSRFKELAEAIDETSGTLSDSFVAGRVSPSLSRTVLQLVERGAKALEPGLGGVGLRSDSPPARLLPFLPGAQLACSQDAFLIENRVDAASTELTVSAISLQDLGPPAAHNLLCRIRAGFTRVAVEGLSD
jgi:hypothetical protein